MTGWAEPSSHRFCSRDPPSTATGGADPATLPLPHGYRPLFGPLSRGSTVGGDGRGRSGDLFPSRTCPVFSPPASRADPSPATTRGPWSCMDRGMRATSPLLPLLPPHLTIRKSILWFFELLYWRLMST
ncbi:hypothetical protein DAI22_04g181800 [Oryza sativa Japonica Group]|nr:hypothetical protein DAI22_04g181800 [Oryza sativa Japonica Group]